MLFVCPDWLRQRKAALKDDSVCWGGAELVLVVCPGWKAAALGPLEEWLEAAAVLVVPAGCRSAGPVSVGETDS